MNFDKRFNLMRRVVFTFMGIVFALIVCVWIGLGVIAYKATTKAAGQDWSGGIKPVLEQFWCGKPGCLEQT